MNDLVKFQEPRLPYHPIIEERFGVSKAQWKVLTEATFPSARTPDSVVMALAYCQARNLDIFKKPIHIVPVWDSKKRDYVETVWPGISELRTTAMRTKLFAGCDEVEFGPEDIQTFNWTDKQNNAHTAEVCFPEWARMTVYRYAHIGAVVERVPIVGPRVYWLETYATIGKSDAPNDMWRKRPRGQIEKCAEAAALRRAFPEELGDEPTAEEMEGHEVSFAPSMDAQPSLTSGFEKPAGRARRPRDAPAATAPAAEGSEGAQAAAQGQAEGGADEAAGDEAQDAEFEDGRVACAGGETVMHQGEAGTFAAEGEQGGAETSTATGPSASAGEPTQTATTASSTATSSADETTGSKSTSADEIRDPPVTGAMDPDSDRPRTRAPSGELYCLTSDQPDEDGRVPTYKDGIGFSRVKVEAKAKPAAFDLHPLPEEDEAQTGEDAANAPAKSNEAPADDGADPFVIARSAMDDAQSYLAAKQVLKSLSGSIHWKPAPEEAKAALRQKLWEIYEQLIEAGKETMAPHEDLTLMRCFLEFGASSQREIDERWKLFFRHPAYKAAPDADKGAIAGIMVDRKAVLP